MNSDTLVKNQSLLIRKGKIKTIGDYKKLPKNKQTTIIDGKGKYLMPSLADMHVHLPEADKIEKLLLANIAAGVTQIRIMNSKVPQLELRDKLSKETQLISPNIHYSYLVKRDETYTESQADSLMLQIKKDKISFIKLLSLSDEQTFENLTKSASKHNIIICGHYPIYQIDNKSKMVAIEKTIKSNFKSIEHLGGYIYLKDNEQLDKAIQLTKEYNTYNCPTLDWDIMSYDLQYPDDYKTRITYQFLPKKLTQNWETDYEAGVVKAGGKEKVIESKNKYSASFDLKLKILKSLYKNHCSLLIGGDAGNNFQANGFNIYEEMVNWSNAGIDNFTILKSATVTPSEFFNESNQWGTIEIGKNAELLILEKNPLTDIKNITTIQTTIIGEKIYNNKELINQL
jgi:imidazolonepropionase-like amidohydrolase